MNIGRHVQLIHNSTDRLERQLRLSRRDSFWWWVVRREAWVHLQRSIELMWLVLRKKE